MRSVIIRFNSNLVAMGTIYVTIGIFISSFFSYILQAYLGRVLSIQDYGEFNSLLSLSLFLSIPITALTSSIVKVISTLKAENEFKVISTLYSRINFFSLGIGLFIFLIMYILQNTLISYLNIQHTASYISFNFYLLVSFILIAPLSYLTGLQRFKGYAVFMTVFGLIRLLIAGILVYLGLSVSGVYLGFVISILIMFLFGYLILNKNLRLKTGKNLKRYYKLIANVGLSSITLALITTSMNNLDVVLVKHLFNSTDAGIYSSVVTLGKILLFGASTISIVMFPIVSEAAQKKENITKLFKLFFSLQIFVVFIGAVIFLLFPKFLILLMFGEGFLIASAYLPSYIFFTSIFVLINFLLLFMLAVNLDKYFVYLLCFIPFHYILISFRNNSIFDVITSNIIIALLTLITITSVLFKSIKN